MHSSRYKTLFSSIGNNYEFQCDKVKHVANFSVPISNQSLENCLMENMINL